MDRRVKIATNTAKITAHLSGLSLQTRDRIEIDQITKRMRARHSPSTALSRRFVTYSALTNLSEAEFMQYRRPVGFGPSLKT